MSLTVKDLLEAGCHFGHQTKRWNPKMKDYVYGAKNGISIIDLTKTIRQVGEACNFLQRKVMNGSKILFVGTKRQAQQIVRETADSTGMYFMSERWMGGTLTNNETIRKSIKKMQEIDAIVADEASSGLKKKEIVRLARTGAKLHRDLDGIASMRHLPDVVVIIDVCHDQNAVKEAKKLSIPIVGIVDTNGDPSDIDFPVAANDDAVKSIKVIIDTFAEAVKDASELYAVKAAERRAKDDAEKAERAKHKPADGEKRNFNRGDRNDRNDRGARRPPRKGPRPEGANAAPKKAEKPVEVKSLSDIKKSDVAPAE